MEPLLPMGRRVASKVWKQGFHWVETKHLMGGCKKASFLLYFTHLFVSLQIENLKQANMFKKEVYIERRKELRKRVESGLILLFGNNEAPCNYPGNAYYPFRQDSSFLYYFGQQRDGLVGVIDIDNGTETLVGDDIDIEDIVWFGSVDSVRDMADQVGVELTAPMKQLQVICNEALRQKRKIHFLPPYRHDTKVQLFDLLGIHPAQQKESASVELIMAIVHMREVKSDLEIAEIEKACAVGYEMHTTAMRLTRPPARGDHAR